MTQPANPSETVCKCEHPVHQVHPFQRLCNTCGLCIPEPAPVACCKENGERTGDGWWGKLQLLAEAALSAESPTSGAKEPKC